MTKCLIVDDSAVNLYLLRSILHSKDWDVFEAQNGKIALEIAKSRPLDIIISDILMPVMDGYDLIRQCKSDDHLKTIPFVFYTATYTEARDEKFAMSLGADRFVIKPQEPEVLLDILNGLLEERKKNGIPSPKPFEEEMEFLRQHNETLFRKLEKKMSDLEKANRELETLGENYRLILENVTDVILMIGTDLHLVNVTPSLEKVLGYKPEDFIGRNISDMVDIFTPKSLKLALTDVVEILQGATIKEKIYEFVAIDGTIKYGEVSGAPIIRDGKITGMVSAARDITKRRQAQHALMASEERFVTAFQSSPAAKFISTLHEGRYIDVNHSALALLGYTREEMIGHSVKELSVWANPEDRDRYVPKLAKDRSIRNENIRIKTKSGEIREVLWSCEIVELNNEDVMLSFLYDITDRKLAEEKYRNLFENVQEGIGLTTPEGKFIMANQSMALMLGYDFPREVIDSIKDINSQLYVDPEERVKMIEALEEQGFVKNYEVRYYKKDRSIIWVSISLRAVRDSRGKVLYYEGIMTDITERKKNIESLRNALEGTVHALASIVETRDPYTAGHQQRVSELARAIAAEMGLPHDRVEGLRVAATIHDIGKIAVPAEMLTKPTKLTKIEFTIIQTHVQAGFDILKDVEFPWPVARMVVEHHERINGTGYPNALTGDNILQESKILAVADVVEAMASHRPYRPSLGVEPALQEIEKNKGILYDTEAADACLRLFREKGFILNEI